MLAGASWSGPGPCAVVVGARRWSRWATSSSVALLRPRLVGLRAGRRRGPAGAGVELAGLDRRRAGRRVRRLRERVGGCRRRRRPRPPPSSAAWSSGRRRWPSASCAPTSSTSAAWSTRAVVAATVLVAYVAGRGRARLGDRGGQAAVPWTRRPSVVLCARARLRGAPAPGDAARRRRPAAVRRPARPAGGGDLARGPDRRRPRAGAGRRSARRSSCPTPASARAARCWRRRGPRSRTRGCCRSGSARTRSARSWSACAPGTSACPPRTRTSCASWPRCWPRPCAPGPMSRDLQKSREAVVTAVEEERRRLRRDLHDGLGPDAERRRVRHRRGPQPAAVRPGQGR